MIAGFHWNIFKNVIYSSEFSATPVFVTWSFRNVYLLLLKLMLKQIVEWYRNCFLFPLVADPCLIPVTCYFKSIQTLRSCVHHTDLNQMKIPSKSTKASREQRSAFALIRTLFSFWNTTADRAFQIFTTILKLIWWKSVAVTATGGSRKKKNDCKNLYLDEILINGEQTVAWRRAFGPFLRSIHNWDFSGKIVDLQSLYK